MSRSPAISTVDTMPESLLGSTPGCTRIQTWSLNEGMVCVTTGCGCFTGDGSSRGHGGTLSSLNGACWGFWIIWVVSTVAKLSTALFSSSGEKELLVTD